MTKIKDGRLFFEAVEVLVFEACCCALLLHAHGQVDKREDVVLNHDGEAEKDGVQGEDVHPQSQIQLPLVQMDPQHLHTHTSKAKWLVLHTTMDHFKVTKTEHVLRLNQCILTVSATEPSRSTTEYTKPRLLIIT